MVDTIEFVVNLRNMTATTEFRRRLRPPGYLVPPAYLTPELRRQAAYFSGSGAIIVADNGLFDDIERLAKQVAHTPRPMRAIRAAALASTVDPTQHFRDQVSVRPTAIIGVEDITAALWLRLGLNAASLPNQRAALRRRNQQTARRATVVAKQVPDSCDYLPVASAQDYDTAYDAGRVFASAGLRAAALGFGAFMNDDSTTGEVKYRGRMRRLETKMPMRYLGTALVAKGFWDGWRAESHQAPDRFHFLGLGAPIMIGITACAADTTPLLTFDATSPMKDAAQGTIYVSEPAYLKIRTWKAAQRLAAADAERWRCPCPFCRSFVRKHPFDYSAGRDWYQRRHIDAVPRTALRAGGSLYRPYPLLAQPSASLFGKEVSFARVGHNHWVLKQVTHALNLARSRRRLVEHVDEVVTNYESATPLRTYAAAVRLAFAIATEAWP